MEMSWNNKRIYSVVKCCEEDEDLTRLVAACWEAVLYGKQWPRLVKVHLARSDELYSGSTTVELVTADTLPADVSDRQRAALSWPPLTEVRQQPLQIDYVIMVAVAIFNRSWNSNKNYSNTSNKCMSSEEQTNTSTPKM